MTGTSAEWEELGKKLGGAILDRTKEALKGEWDGMPDEDKAKVKRAAIELAKEEAKARLGIGEADQERITVLSATIANWIMVGRIKAESVKRAFWEGVKEAAKDGLEIAGGFLVKLATETLKGLVKDIDIDL